MSANLPPRFRPSGGREPVQRDDRGEARLWHLGTALAVSFTVAVAGLAGLAWLAWVLLGVAGYRHRGAAPELKDTVSVLQLVFATVAGAGALVALMVAYRRQKITEADSVHDRTRVFNERFTAIAAQLGDAQPAVRLAGVHVHGQPVDLQLAQVRTGAAELDDRSDQPPRSSSVNTLSRLSSRSRCSTGVNGEQSGDRPCTIWVGESGVRRFGYCSSSAFSSRILAS